MIITTKTEVFRDTLTGMCYAESFRVRPVVALTNKVDTVVKGVYLEPFGDHPDIQWGGVVEDDTPEKHRKLFGFDALDWAQDVFVPDEVFQTRFESLGEKVQTFDMEAAIRHYESERVSFSDEQLVEMAKRQLAKIRSTSLRECLVYALMRSVVNK